MPKNSFYIYLLSFTFVGFLSFFSVYESGDLPVGTAFYNGSVSHGIPINLHHYTANFLLAEIYMFLFSVMPEIPWYALILFFYMAISIAAILHILISRTKEHTSTYVLIGITAVVFFLAIESIVLLQYTRVAFLMGIASTLFLLDALERNRILFSLLFMIFALLTRWEVGVLTAVIQLLVVLFFTKGKTFYKGLILNSTVVALLIAYIAYDKVVANDFISQFQPELGYQLLDRGNIVPLGEMKNSVDSVRYEAVLNMIADPKFISIPFLRSLVKEDPFIGFDIHLVKRSIEIMYANFCQLRGIYLMYLCLLLLLIIFSYRNQKEFVSKILLFNLIICAMLFAIAYFIKMELWLMSSMILFVSIIHMYFLAQNVTIIKKYWLATAVILFTSALFIQYTTVSQYMSLLKNQTNENRAFLEMTEEKCKGKIIVPDLGTNQILLTTVSPHGIPDFKAFSAIYFLDADVMHIVKTYHAYLHSICNCNPNNYIELMDFIYEKRDSVVFIGDESRLAFIEKYCRVVRKKEYTFSVIDSIKTNSINKKVIVFDKYKKAE